MGKILKPIIIIGLVLIIILSTLLPIYSSVSANDEASGMSSLSLFDRASEVARTFGTAIAPGTETGLAMIQSGDVGGDLLPGNAGGFLGYADYMSDDSGVTGWFSSAFSQSSDMFTYEQMASIVPGTDESGVFAGKNNPFFHYAGYGELLNGMGLIGTSRTGSIMGTMASVGTFIVVVAYLVANAAPFLFSIALTILNVLNPFKLFFTAFEGMGNTNLGLLSGVANFVGGLYETIQTFSIYALFPLLLVITVIGALVFTRTSALKRFARYGLRLFMLFAGLPIIGATYTGVIEDMNDKVDTGAEYADYLVLSSYVDFQNWASNTRLAVPDTGSTVIMKNPRATSEGSPGSMPVPSRDLVLSINGPLAGHSDATKLMNSYGGNNLGDTFRNTRSRSENNGGSSQFGTTMDLLLRHMGGASYSGSQYAGEVTGTINRMWDATSISDDEDAELTANEVAILKMFTLTGSDSRTWSQRVTGENSEWAKAVDWNDAQGLFTHGQADKEAFQFSEYPYNIYNNGGLTASSVGLYTNAYTIPDMSASDASPLKPISSTDDNVGGLSPLAMYNFLNTTFTDTGMTVFSPEDTVVDSARDTYASVKMSSSGVTMFARWVENVVVMVSMATLALAYGGILISAAIKNVPRIISGVFGTALGSIAFTAKLLISTVVMIIQVLGMILLYFLSEMILMSMIMNMNTFTAALTDRFSGIGMLVEFGRAMLTTIIVALLTWFMIKNVNIFKEMMEEVVTNGINKFMSLLDTSTGGEGLSTANTSGGRVGADGKLTDDARADSRKGPLAGAAGMLSDAHGIEAKREQMAQENGMGNRGFGQMIKSRGQTLKDLAGAKGKDMAKSPFAKDPKSYQREMDAKERSVRQAGLKDETGEYAKNHGFNYAESPTAKAGKALKGLPGELGKGISAKTKALGAATAGKSGDFDAMGRKLDAEGNVETDKFGNAVDANGEPISNKPALGTTTGTFGGKSVDVDPDTGALLDENGDIYRDENGNAFYQDEDGKLVDENGNYMALDSDGTLQPIESLPDHDGSPVDATESAMALDNMRSDAEGYAAMQESQEPSHYGMDTDGNAIDIDGNQMTYTDENGDEQPVQFDDEGYLTDNMGNRLDVSELNGVADGRGYDIVEDPETGEQHVQHAGDDAMKQGLSDNALSDDPSKTDEMSLDQLAQESARANALAEQAETNLENLKDQGAPAYAIAQAERHVEKTKAQAAKVDSKLANAMQDDKSRKGAAKPVTKAQADSAKRNADKQASTLKQEEAKLKQLKADGASPQAIARQERKVDAQRKSALAANNAAKDAAIANQAGRPLSEVSDARERTERAEAVLDKALEHQAQGIKDGVSDSEMQKRNAAVAKATGLVTKAKDNQARMAEAPQGTVEQRDKTSAAHEQAKSAHRQAEAKVERLERKSKPMAESEVRKLKNQQTEAQQTMLDTRKDAKRHTQAQTAYKEASTNVDKHQGVVDKLTRRGADPAKIQAATTQLNQAKSKQAEARQAMSRSASGAQKHKQAQSNYTQATNRLNQAGRPMTAEETATVKQTQATAKTAMNNNKSDFDNYKRQQSAHKQAKRAANASKRDVEKLVKQGAPAATIQEAKAKHSRALEKVNQSDAAKRQYSNGANAYREAQTTYTQAQRRLDQSQPTVSEREVEQARREERQAAKQVERTGRRRQQAGSPKGWKAVDPSSVSTRVPETSNEKGYANLAGSGVNSYADYQEKVTGYQSSIQESRQRAAQARSQAKAMKASGRPVQEIKRVQEQINKMDADTKAKESQLSGLQNNAHGLLRRMPFDVPGVTRGNVTVSGAVIANQLETLGHVQQMRSEIEIKRQNGTATAEDEKRHHTLNDRLSNMRKSLNQSGISENVLKDESSIQTARDSIRESWGNFVNGRHGNTDGATGGTTGRRTGRTNPPKNSGRSRR